MSLPWRSRFVHGTGGDVVTWDLSLPIRAWDRVTSTTGGARTSAGGVPASHVVRRDENLALTIRFRESEWPDLHALLQWGQLAESFEWYPDQLDEDESYEVYLESPQAGQDATPTRSEEYPKVLEITITLRRVAFEPWDLDYFASE